MTDPLNPPGAPDAGDVVEDAYAAGEVVASKYQLTHVLGEGGMGSIWLARNLALDADVAIKFIRRDLASREATEQLQLEARAAARIGHPSIVRVFDFGETERGDPFIVMEVLSGESLADMLDRKQRLSAAEAIRVLLPIVNALCAVHGRGVIHRDLKPENILLVTDDNGVVVPKLLDFGIAKLRRTGAPEGPMLGAGQVFGSPDYMAPEQAMGAEVDERADVWALSVVLYEMITGRLPFTGPDFGAVMAAIVHQEPDAAPEIEKESEELWGIVKRGLARKTNARWRSMWLFGVALASWAVDSGIGTDISGTSIAAQWLTRGARMPLAEGARETGSEVLAAPRNEAARESEGGLERPPRSATTGIGWGAVARNRRVLAVVAALVVGGFAVVLARRAPEHAAGTPAPPSAVAAPETAAAPPEVPATTTSGASPAAAPRRSSAEVNGCLASVFAPGTFDAHPMQDISYVCTETDPRRGAGVLQTELVAASQGSAITAGLREWGSLNWYELVAFAAIRGACCPGAAPLTLPASGPCPRLDAVLDEVAAGAAAGDNVDPLLERYKDAIACAQSSGIGSMYRYRGKPQPSEYTMLRRTLGRIIQRR